MSTLLLNESSSVSGSPASNKGRVILDASGIVLTEDDAGRFYGKSFNAAVAAQGAGFATDTYVTNSNILIPTIISLQAKTHVIWQISASKSAASTATPIYSIRLGAAGAIGDTAILALTAPAQTAIADIGTLNVMVTLRNIGASGVLQGTAWWNHRGTVASSTGGTGFANDGTGHVEASSSTFDTTGKGGQFIGLSINGGTSAAWTLTQCIGEATW